MNNRIDPIRCRRCKQLFRTVRDSDGYCTDKCRRGVTVSQAQYRKYAKSRDESQAARTQADAFPHVPTVTPKSAAVISAAIPDLLPHFPKRNDWLEHFDIHEDQTEGTLYHAFAYSEPRAGSRAAYTVERRYDGGPWLLYPLYENGYEKGCLIGKYVG